MASWRILSMVAALLATSFFTSSVAAHGCGRDLSACLGHLKRPDGQKPPATCCSPLVTAVANRNTCLCDIFPDSDDKLADLADSCGIDSELTAFVSTFCRNERRVLAGCPFCCRRDKQGLCVATCCKK